MSTQNETNSLSNFPSKENTNELELSDWIVVTQALNQGSGSAELPEYIENEMVDRKSNDLPDRLIIKDSDKSERIEQDQRDRSVETIGIEDSASVGKRKGPEADIKSCEDFNTSATNVELDLNVKELPYTVFSKNQRLLIFIIIVYVGFLGPLSGNIYIPALPLLQRVYGISATGINATVSVFMAVFSVGPLFWASLADFGGRKLLYIISLTLTVIATLLLAVVPVNIGALFFLRILQAFASSSVMSLGAGTVSDITPPRIRGKSIAYFMLGPNFGPILAPIMAGLILMKGDYWRWLFGFICILSGIGLFLVIFFLPETLRCIVGNGDESWKTGDIQSLKVQGGPAKIKVLTDIGIQKPVSSSSEFHRLYPRPPRPNLTTYWDLIKFLPVTICSVTTAILFSAYYAFSVTFSHFLRDYYRLTNLQIGACYVCPGVALLLGSVIGGHLSDYLRKRWIGRHIGQQFPSEKRLVLQIWGLILNICGCIGYGWSIQFRYDLSVVLVFTFFMAFGMTWCSNASMTYLTECVPRRAAATVAVGSFFRNLAAGISSVIILKLCNLMGPGWCFTGLAFCDIAAMLGILVLIENSSEWTS